MQIFAERLEPELWCIVIKHVTIVEDTVILAMMNKYFYKLVNMDFKKLCYDHLVYRLEGETWAHAFLKLGGRLFNVIPSNKRFYAENTVCCPFTGKIAIKLEGGYVVLTNIDFALNEVKLLDFTSYTKEVTRVNMINRGKELLVRTHYFILVYDLHSMEVKGKYWQKDKFEFQIVQDGTIFDYYTKKEYKIDAVHPNGTINYVNAYDNSKYIGVHTRDNKLVIINTETDERHEVCKWTLKMVVVYVINENDSVLIQEGLAGRIYSIKQKQFVFNYSDHTWFLNSNAFFDSIGLFTFYNKQSTQWQTVKIDPSLRLSYRYQVYCSVGFVPMPNNKLMESYKNNVLERIYLCFKKDSVRVKTFSTKLKQLSQNERRSDITSYYHPLCFLSRMRYWPDKSNDFLKPFIQMDSLTPVVSVVDARTGTAKYLSFYKSS